MARIIVTADKTGQKDAPVLLDEDVYSVHLSTDHAARALIERLVWALGDAEELERLRVPRRSPSLTDGDVAVAGARAVPVAA
jgi:hypothetical protein